VLTWRARDFARRRLHEELKGVGGSHRLAEQVASCTGKALRVLAEKAEYMTATGLSVLCLLLSEPAKAKLWHAACVCKGRICSSA
jgi:hypothetical protein